MGANNRIGARRTAERKARPALRAALPISDRREYAERGEIEQSAARATAAV